MAKKETERALQEKIARDLEGLLDGSAMGETNLPANTNNNVPSELSLGDKLEHPNAQPMDFHKKKDEAKAEARKTLNSLMKFYLGEKIIKKNEYTKYKKRVDEMSLSNMMFAIETSQHAIIKLLEEIDMGNTHPRNFEAIASLNSQMMNMVKHQQALFVTMEEGYKKIKHDQEEVDQEDRTEDGDAEDVTSVLSGSFKTRGTKMLMKNLRKEVGNDAPESDENDVRLTDAFHRPENTIMELDQDDDMDDGDEIYGDLGEHF